MHTYTFTYTCIYTYITFSRLCFFGFIFFLLPSLLTIVNEFVKSFDDLCVPFIKPSPSTGKYKNSLPLLKRQLRRVSKILRNFHIFHDVISPAVYERVIWNFVCNKVIPALIANLNVVDDEGYEGKTCAIAICTDFIKVSPLAPLYGNQISVSRSQFLSALSNAVTNININANNDNNGNNRDGGSMESSLDYLLQKMMTLGSGSVSVASREVINNNAAEAFLAMNASAMMS